jgi:surface antigen
LEYFHGFNRLVHVPRAKAFDGRIDANTSGSSLETMMRQLIWLGIVLAAMGFAAPAVAQAYDDVDSGTTCRAVAGQAEIDGSMQQVVGRACLQSDGTWQIVEDTDGSTLVYPVAFYPYPDQWYWGPPLFIGAGVSFVFVDRFHHHYHFDHFHQMGHMHVGAPVGFGFHGGPARFGGGMHGFWGAHRR